MLSNRFKIVGDIRLPGDKSIAHRALLLSTFKKDVHSLDNFPINQDLLTTLSILNQCGLTHKFKGNKLCINSRYINFQDLSINCNNSGTTARLFCGYLSGLNINCNIFGENSLSKRPMSRIVEPLKSFGVSISSTKGMLPINIQQTKQMRAAFNYKLKIASAQVKSALILYALSIEGTSIIEESIKTRDHLELLLLYLGYPIEINGNKILVTGKRKILHNLDIGLPGDISSASFLIATAILLKDSNLIIRDIAINQYRMGFVDSLIEMGAKIDLTNKCIKYGEMVADIRIQYSSKLKGITIDSDKIPSMIDEIPIFCVVAAFADSPSVIRGVGELKFKESNRIKAIIDNFKNMNGDISYNDGNLLIKPKNKMYNTTILSFDDHRIFMSFYIANLALGKFYSDNLNDKAYVKSFQEFIDIMKDNIHENI